MITSKSNEKIRYVKKLLTSASERRKSGLFVAEGRRLVNEIPEGLISQLYISAPAGPGELAEPVRSAIAAGRAENVSEDVMRYISGTVNPQGVIAVVRKPEADAETFRRRESCRLLMLDDVQDPGNMGTMIRTAEAAGVDAVFVSPGCVDIYNPKVVRSTMGSLFRLPVISTDIAAEIKTLKEEGIKVYGAALRDAVSFRQESYPKRMALIIGNEANGISEDILKMTDLNIMIPMAGKVESLNAAVSCAILLFCNNIHI